MQKVPDSYQSLIQNLNSEVASTNNPDLARKALFDITKSLQGRSGGLRIIPPGDSESKIVVSLATWGRRGNLADQLEGTREFVKSAFRHAYQPIIDRLPLGPDKLDKQSALDDLIEDFNNTVENKKNVFGKNTMRKFFNRAEQEFTSSLNKVNSGRNGRISGTEFVSFSDSNRSVSPLPVFQPYVHKDLKTLFQRTAQLNLNIGDGDNFLGDQNQAIGAGVNQLGESGAFGTAFEISSPNGQNPQVLKIANNLKSIHYMSPDLRDNDGAAFYLPSSKHSAIPGVVMSTDLFIVAQDKKDNTKKYYHIPLANCHEAKKFVRDLRRTNRIGVVAQLMPKARGQVLEKIDLKNKPQDRWAFAKQAFSATKKLNERGLIDRDIKTDNYLYDTTSKKAEKIDNGLMIKVSQSESKKRCGTSLCGTPDYLHPKLMVENPKYGPEVDAFSLAMTLARNKYGQSFLDACSQRYLDPDNIGKGLSEKYISSKSKYPNRSEIEILMAFADYKNTDLFNSIYRAVFRDIRNGDPEAKFIQKLMDISFTEPDFTKSGRNEIYMDYYQALNDLMNDPYLNNTPEGLNLEHYPHLNPPSSNSPNRMAADFQEAETGRSRDTQFYDAADAQNPPAAQSVDPQPIAQEPVANSASSQKFDNIAFGLFVATDTTVRPRVNNADWSKATNKPPELQNYVHIPSAADGYCLLTSLAAARNQTTKELIAELQQAAQEIGETDVLKLELENAKKAVGIDHKNIANLLKKLGIAFKEVLLYDSTPPGYFTSSEVPEGAQLTANDPVLLFRGEHFDLLVPKEVADRNNLPYDGSQFIKNVAR